MRRHLSPDTLLSFTGKSNLMKNVVPEQGQWAWSTKFQEIQAALHSPVTKCPHEIKKSIITKNLTPEQGLEAWSDNNSKNSFSFSTSTNDSSQRFKSQFPSNLRRE